MKAIIFFGILILVGCKVGAQQNKTQTIQSGGCGGPLPAAILIHPTNQTSCDGSQVIFTDRTYYSTYGYWEMSTDNGGNWTAVFIPNSYSIHTDVNGTFNDTLVLSSVSPSLNGYQFRQICYSPCGPVVYTLPATLTISNQATLINNQPVSMSACKGTSADFAVSTTGSSLTYQWQQSIDGGINFTNMFANRTASLHFDSVSLEMNNYKFRCITNSDCNPSVISTEVTLTVLNESTVINNQPTDQKICPGDTAVLNVGVSGNNISYQWQKHAAQDNYYTYTDIPGATGSRLKLGYSSTGLTYRCKINSTCKAIYSNTVAVDSFPNPNFSEAAIKYQCTGELVQIFAILNNQYTDFSYQWQVSTDSGITYVNLPANTTNFLSIYMTSAMNGNRYRCIVYNGCNNSFSNIHTLYNVYVPITITSQPHETIACDGFPALITVRATGKIISERWQVSTDNGVNYIDIYDYDENLYFYTVSLSQNNNLYRCKIVSSCGDTAYSNPALLKIYLSPALPNDTTFNVSCDTCTTDISHAYATSGYVSAIWSIDNPVSVMRGKYILKVYNESGCSDSAFIHVSVNQNDTLKVCKGSIGVFTTRVLGSTYQWQWAYESGGGFSNLYNDVSSGYQGVTTPVLTMQKMQSSGKVRCVVNGNLYSSESTVKIACFWTGTISSEWENPLNWSCGEVPDINTEIYVLANGALMPELNSNAACKKLILEKGAGINIKAGKNLYIVGR